jgi:hypothetical protein
VLDKFGEYGTVKAGTTAPACPCRAAFPCLSHAGLAVNMPMDRRTGYIKGYAFVEYETKQARMQMLLPVTFSSECTRRRRNRLLKAPAGASLSAAGTSLLSCKCQRHVAGSNCSAAR